MSCELVTASRMLLRETEARIVAREGFAFETTFRVVAVDHCSCFMNNGDRPVLTFEQRGGQRKIVNEALFKQLVREAGI